MRRFASWIAVAAAGSGACFAQPAHAARPTCDDLLSAVATGRSRPQVAQEFNTTEAHISACEALAKNQERQVARRERFESRRIDRGLPLDE